MGVVASTTGAADRWDVEPLAKDAQAVLDAAGRGEWELSILVCDDEFIRPLNQQWRGKDTATDVLSFPQLSFIEPETPSFPPEGPVLLGDVVISIETAAEAARTLGHDLETELRVLLVHGICHLFGHEHGTPEQRGRMTVREAALLDSVGLAAAGLVARANPNG